MAKSFPLDVTLIEGRDYQTRSRQVLVIRRIGTDATSPAHLNIDEKPLGDIITTVAPLHKTSSNLLGPLYLDKLYYVVPPETKVIVEGPSGAKMRCVGYQILLEPGEPFADPYKARFKLQPNHYLTYVEGSYSLGTDVVWKDKAEYEVYSLTPKTIETYWFNRVVMGSITGDTVSEGDFGIRFYLDGRPLDWVLEKTPVAGIDVLSMPRPPADTTEEEPFTLKELPVEVLGDHTISIRARNISGADKSPATGASWKITVTAIVEFLRKP